ncbi:MAG: hypothetical protein ACRDKT_14155, partial [Actinomycetota bacterium]
DESTETGRRVDFSVASMPRNVAGVPINPVEWNRNDGFSPGALIVTKVPGLDTPEAFAATNPVSLRDLSRYDDADAPVVVLNAETGERHPIWTEIDATTTSPEGTVFLIRPATNFEEGTRYIVALRDLKDASGTTLEANDAFTEFRDAEPAQCEHEPKESNGKGKGNAHGHDKDRGFRDECVGDPAGDDAERARHFQGLFWTLEGAGIPRGDLYLAWDFTVASERNLSERMLHIRDDAFARLGDENLADLQVEGDSPSFTIDTVTDRPDDAPRVLRRVEGTVSVPCYLNLPKCPPGSQFAYAGLDSTTPVPIPGNTYDAKFICNIPESVLTNGPARPSLYGHGLLGSADQVNDDKLYSLGNDHNLMFCGADWIGMAEEDTPNDAAILAELGRFPTLADRMQQGFLNFLYIGRTAIHPDGFSSDPAFQIDGASTIDTQRLYYDGGSQGGIAGGGLTAVAPDFTRAALGVPAMNYSTLLNRSVDFDIFEVIMDQAYPNEIERQLLFSLIQILWDRGEANGYAHHMTDDPLPNTPAHEVLLHMAFGDHQVTNWATLVEARTIGAAIRVPELDPGRDPTADMFWGIEEITSYPYAGSAIVVWDVGPTRVENGETKGTDPPPIENVPNRAGIDPHGPDASETVDGQFQIGTFLTPNGVVNAVCGDAPCYLDGWTGPGA